MEYRNTLNNVRRRLYPTYNKNTNKYQMGIASALIYGIFIFILVYMILYLININYYMNRNEDGDTEGDFNCLLYTSPSPRDRS